MSSEERRNVKIVVVGDGAVGKTSLITAYGENTFPTDYIPTVSDTFTGPCTYNGEEITLRIWDTSGQQEFENIRPIAYNGADAFVVCFSLVDKDSLENACTKWKDELIKVGPHNCPKILCGTKADLRDSLAAKGETHFEGKEIVDNQMAMQFKQQHGFFSYVESSAKEFHNCGLVFFEGIKGTIMMAELNKVEDKPALLNESSKVPGSKAAND